MGLVSDINNINAPRPGKPSSAGSDAVDKQSGPVSRAGTATSSSSNRGKAESGANASASDTVELSAQAQELGRIQQSLQALPDIDEAKVSEIRERISNGSFVIDAEQIAERILADDQFFGDR